MAGIKDSILDFAGKVYVKVSGVAQEKTLREKEAKTVSEEMKNTLRRVAGEGAVLLKNDGTLPFRKNETLSLFGRVQYNWFYTGYGSGGDVNRPYQVNLIDGIRACDSLKLNESLCKKYEKWSRENVINDAIWGMWPRFYPEMPVTDGDVLNAQIVSDCAVVTIGRSSGEDRENALSKGSYYLTDEEKQLLDKVTYRFEKTVVLLNIGSITDLSWIEEYGDKISAVLLLWQGGMESGNAAADILCGKVSPCGRLSSTVSRQYSDQPSAKHFGGKKFNNYSEDIYVGYRYFETFDKSSVLYPFGYGLSYTTFKKECVGASAEKDGFIFEINIENTGDIKGKDVYQLYVKKPSGEIGNPQRELVAFGKTKALSPSKSQSIKVKVPMSNLSSYDENKSAYVLPGGEYEFYFGDDVRSAQKAYSYYQEETVVLNQLSQCLAPEESFPVMIAREVDGEIIPDVTNCRKSQIDLKQRIIENLPEATPITGDKGYKLSDVKSGAVSMDDFVAQLSLDELEAITRGDYTMGSSLGVPGNAAVYCGVLESLRDKGIPAVSATDGPSGIRLRASCSLIPIGTLLASTFDVNAVKEVYSLVAKEMKEKGSDVLLAPGMNIHRNPLCGRNFEYYSEDPLLTGKIGAAAVMGIQSEGGSACPKHFACNNQEIKRTVNDSRVSERALREIYLKGFEICIKEAKPKNIMTSYNKINGVWSYYNYDLATSILRGEWGYEGCVMTDWWTKSGTSPLFPKVYDQAYRVRAQVDVLMPGGGRTGKRKPDGSLLKYVDDGGITLGEIQRSAKNVLNFALTKI